MGTRTAFSAWEDRIAPVFDVARQVLVVDTGTGGEPVQTMETLDSDLPAQKALRLVELGATTLVCGAISRPVQEIVEAYGIAVVPFVSGDLSEVIGAFFAKRPAMDAFAMPGCCMRRGRARQGPAGGGRGRGRAARRPFAGPEGFCVCRACGRREKHVEGTPCSGLKCPDCGAAMVRD